MAAYEFRVVWLPSFDAEEAEEILNALGANGWQLVTVQALGFQGYPGDVRAFLQRRPDEQPRPDEGGGL